MLYKGEINHFSKDYEKKKVYMKRTEKKKKNEKLGMSCHVTYKKNRSSLSLLK